VELLLVAICVSFGWVSCKTYQLWQLEIQMENIKQAKGNECSQYKSTVCPCAPFIFTLLCLGMFWVHVMHVMNTLGV
jgi:hypothetical protein